MMTAERSDEGIRAERVYLKEGESYDIKRR